MWDWLTTKVRPKNEESADIVEALPLPVPEPIAVVGLMEAAELPLFADDLAVEAFVRGGWNQYHEHDINDSLQLNLQKMMRITPVNFFGMKMLAKTDGRFAFRLATGGPGLPVKVRGSMRMFIFIPTTITYGNGGHVLNTRMASGALSDAVSRRLEGLAYQTGMTIGGWLDSAHGVYAIFVQRYNGPCFNLMDLLNAAREGNEEKY